MKEVNKNFFKKWSSDMAYVTGFLAADGGLVKAKNGGYFLAFYSKDKELLGSIKETMGSAHKLSKRSPRSGEVYRIQIGSKEIFEDLSKLGFGPKKVRRLKIPAIPKKYFGDFVRGYFDGDGNIWVGYTNKQRPKPTSVAQVSFTSQSKYFLQDLKERLNGIGLQGGTFFRVKNADCYRISFSTLDSLKLYEIMYNDSPKLFLERKRLRFQQFKEMRV